MYLHLMPDNISRMRAATHRRVHAVVVTLVAVGVLVGSLPAQAALRHPPRTVLYTGFGHEASGAWSSEWANGNRQGCAVGIGDGIPSYSKKVEFASSHWTHIRIERTRMPDVVKLRAWTHLGNGGYPTGPSHLFDTTLRPHTKDGEITAWTVVFNAGSAKRYFLNLHLKWNNICGGQAADYAFKMVRA
jgi:hypothetical protein